MNAKPNEKGLRGHQPSSGFAEEYHGGNTPWAVLMRHRWQFLSCLLIVCMVAFLATKFRQVKYEAVARVQIESGPPRLAGLGAIGGGPDDYFRTQCQLLQSHHVLTRALKNLNRHRDDWESDQDALQKLQNSIRVNPVSGSRLIDIVGVATTPARSAAIANEVTAAFITCSEETRRAANSRMLECVNQQIALGDKQIAKLHGKLKDFREAHKITGNNTGLAMAESRIMQIEQKLSAISMEKIALHNQRKKYERILSNGQGLEQRDISLAELNNHASIKTLENKLSTLEQEAEQLARVYLPGHEKLRSTRFQLESLRREIQDKRYQLLGQFLYEASDQLTALSQEEKTLQEQLRNEREAGVALTERHATYQGMIAELETAKRLRDKYELDAQQFHLEKGMRSIPVTLVDAARIPRNPAGLSKEHQAASILLLGILFSITLVFVVDRFTLGDTKEDEGYYHPLYIPVPDAAWGAYRETVWPKQGQANGKDGGSDRLWLGEIGAMALGGNSQDDRAFKSRCRIVHSDQRSEEAEAFRSLGSKLLSRFGQTRQSVVITGNESGNGKTTCATNLALMLAQSGRQILLVDGNLTNSTLERVFSVDKNTPGLTDVLSDINRLKEALQGSDVANLDVLCRGTHPGNEQQFSPYHVSTLVNELLETYDWVIIDGGNLDHYLTRGLLQGIGKAIVVDSSYDTAVVDRLINIVEQSGATAVGYIENHVGQNVGDPGRTSRQHSQV